MLKFQLAFLHVIPPSFAQIKIMVVKETHPEREKDRNFVLLGLSPFLASPPTLRLKKQVWVVNRAASDYGRFIIYLVKLLLIHSHASLYIFFPLKVRSCT